MAFDDELVEVAGLLVVVALEGEITEDQKDDRDQAAHLGVIVGVHARGRKRL